MVTVSKPKPRPARLPPGYRIIKINGKWTRVNKAGQPNLLDYVKGDSTYMQQWAGFNKAAADFAAEQGLNRSDYMSRYGQTKRDWGINRREAFENLQDDYASRGIVRSGLYNTARGDVDRLTLNQLRDLDTQKTGFMRGLGLESTRFKNEQWLARQQALADASRRRQERYNL